MEHRHHISVQPVNTRADSILNTLPRRRKARHHRRVKPVDSATNLIPRRRPPRRNRLHSSRPCRPNPIHERVERIRDRSPRLTASLRLREEICQARHQSSQRHRDQANGTHAHDSIKRHLRCLRHIRGLSELQQPTSSLHSIDSSHGRTQQLERSHSRPDHHNQGRNNIRVPGHPIKHILQRVRHPLNNRHGATTERASNIRPKRSKHASQGGPSIPQGLEHVPHRQASIPEVKQEINQPRVFLETKDRTREITLGENIPHALQGRHSRVVNPTKCLRRAIRHHTHEIRERRLDLVNNAHSARHQGGLQVTPRTLNSGGTRCSLFSDVRETQVQNRLIELLSRDLALRHGITEITNIRAISQKGFLELARCAGDRIRQLVPVLRRELALTSRLGKHHANRLESLSITTRHSIEIARGLSKTVIALHAISSQLGSDVLDVTELVDGVIRVLLRTSSQLIDLTSRHTRKTERRLELVRSVRRIQGLASHVSETRRRRNTTNRPERESTSLGDTLKRGAKTGLDLLLSRSRISTGQLLTDRFLKALHGRRNLNPRSA